ncbi:outer membrane lipoprotein carrier protein LolA [Solemya velesiana gill symbiont]|uniref:Outer-membrane lipoprotein carrier protein n=2 Tax=Solemya velesiana gill symbiont TaxID=1918948 RepID=A0A1T2KQP3_9GAMM|nr:outer membrane lipoprotein carrier protein LolA [Solemya velesiana gill symbiont]
MKRFIAAMLLLLTCSAHAGTGVDQMNTFLQEVRTLKAAFEQSVLDQDHESAARSQGMFYLKRPGYFRWDYSEPEDQMIVADGRQIWHLDPELEQASVQNQETALKGTPAMLLITGDPVENHFEVIDIGNRQGMGWVELIPRDQESQFTRILLAFTNNELRRMEMADKFGQITRFQFFDIECNIEFESNFFRYVPPEGLDIFRPD